MAQINTEACKDWLNESHKSANKDERELASIILTVRMQTELGIGPTHHTRRAITPTLFSKVLRSSLSAVGTKDCAIRNLLAALRIDANHSSFSDRQYAGAHGFATIQHKNRP
jgi:hypothetical protein